MASSAAGGSARASGPASITDETNARPIRNAGMPATQPHGAARSKRSEPRQLVVSRSFAGIGDVAAKIAQASASRRAYHGSIVPVQSTDDRRRPRFWRPDPRSVTGMLRVEHEDRLKITYAEHFTVVVVYEGAFDGWYRGRVRHHVAGSLKLKEPGEVHRGLQVHAPFTLQGAELSREHIAAAADAMGLRGGLHFKAPGFAPGERATQLAFAMHDALVRDG